MTLEKTILKNLLCSEDYCRKVLPFIKEDYFSGEDKILFSQINQFIADYNQRPTVEALTIDIDALRGVSEDEAKACKSALASFDFNEKSNEDWLLKSTEEFCQEKAIYLAMMKSIEIMNDKNGTLQKGAIPSLLTDALSVSDRKSTRLNSSH